MAGGGAGGDAPDAQASALGLPHGQPQPPKRLSPSWDTTNYGGVQRAVSIFPEGTRTLAVGNDPSTWPFRVHCHAGMYRSTAWMGLYRCVIQGCPLADAVREIEHHRGLRPKASVTLLYNRVLPRLAPERAAQDPMVSLLWKCAARTVDPAGQLAVRPGLTRGR